MKKEKKYLTIKDGGFLQSVSWFLFQEKLGNKIIVLKEEGYSAKAIEHNLPFVGSYLFIPRGPIFYQKGFVGKCANSLVESARKTGVAWIRIEPQTREDLAALEIFFGKLGFELIKTKKNHQPAQTLILDLTKTKEELLLEMKAKTRYNIRLAEKKGVKIEKKRDENRIENFIQLSKETAKRDRITIHPEIYYRKMLKIIPEETLSLYSASFEGKIIAIAIVSFHGSVATYLHGASSAENRNVMAPYLLQWKIICDAKEKGFERYDFGGTKIEKNKKGQLLENSWSGITKFKLGFCPKCEPFSFPGCWDVVIDKKKYYTYRVLQNIKDSMRKIKLKISKNA